MSWIGEAGIGEEGGERGLALDLLVEEVVEVGGADAG